MKTSVNTLLERSLTAFTLWGYGWKRRKQSDSATCRIEWQDPMTGLWYGEQNAMKLLRGYALADYRKVSPKTDNYRSYF